MPSQLRRRNIVCFQWEFWKVFRFVFLICWYRLKIDGIGDCFNSFQFVDICVLDFHIPWTISVSVKGEVGRRNQQITIWNTYEWTLINELKHIQRSNQNSNNSGNERLFINTLIGTVCLQKSHHGRHLCRIRVSDQHVHSSLWVHINQNIFAFFWRRKSIVIDHFGPTHAWLTHVRSHASFYLK